MTAKGPAAYFTMDVAKLGRDGLVMVGEVNCLNRWMIAFDNMRERSTNLLEKTFLSEIVAALRDDAERIQMELAHYAQARGAGKIVEKPADKPEQNAPSTATEN